MVAYTFEWLGLGFAKRPLVSYTDSWFGETYAKL